MSFSEENEVSIKSKGGTELSKRSLAKLIPKDLADQFQIIPAKVRDLDPNKPRIFWCHDNAEDPEVQHLRDPVLRNRFAKVVFSSYWQMNDYMTKLDLPYDNKLAVIETPIKPIPAHEKIFDDGLRMVYFSMPNRGLQLLVPMFEQLTMMTKVKLHLDVFSSFEIYGWDIDNSDSWKLLQNQMTSNPNITYHGFAEHDVVMEHLQQAHILAYPSIYRETSCRVLIESMSAGLVCVHPDLAALPDTSGGLTSMYQYVDDHQAHSEIFMTELHKAVHSIVDNEEFREHLKLIKEYADARFNERHIANKWVALMKGILDG